MYVFCTVEKSKNLYPLSKLEVDHVLRTYTLKLFDNGVYLPFNKINELKFKKKSKGTGKK